MKVHSLIRRQEGHEVVMEGVRYAFRPPEWICEVNEPRHAARFATIKEGYRLELAALQLDPPGSTVTVRQVHAATDAKRARRPRGRQILDHTLPVVTREVSA